ncbi:MAG TPA: hypothetical protein VKV95_02770 [Terriglobia bacterium]|nr:hypothetical protein [Terriglobia bacterium]
MNINGHGLRDHIRFAGPLFGVIAAVWALRLILAAAGAPRPLVMMASVTVAHAFCILLVAVLIHVRRFGSYSNVVVFAFLFTAWSNLLVSAAIALSALTGNENIYSSPEFSAHLLSPTKHIIGHLTFGIGFGTIIGSAMGCLLLLLLRRLPADHVQAKRL